MFKRSKFEYYLKRNYNEYPDNVTPIPSEYEYNCIGLYNGTYQFLSSQVKPKLAYPSNIVIRDATYDQWHVYWYLNNNTWVFVIRARGNDAWGINPDNVIWCDFDFYDTNGNLVYWGDNNANKVVWKTCNPEYYSLNNSNWKDCRAECYDSAWK